jgi:dolichol-phosphate mannosyltransferase
MWEGVKTRTGSEGRVLRGLLLRIGRFNVVGLLGIPVHTLTLALLVWAGLHYLAATIVAVDVAVLHNFVWHRKWTWADRAQRRAGAALMRFNLTTGVTSIAGNLVLMWLLVDGVGLNVYFANLAAIACCSLVNFILSDRVVFL